MPTESRITKSPPSGPRRAKPSQRESKVAGSSGLLLTLKIAPIALIKIVDVLRPGLLFDSHSFQLEILCLHKLTVVNYFPTVWSTQGQAVPERKQGCRIKWSIVAAEDCTYRAHKDCRCPEARFAFRFTLVSTRDTLSSQADCR